MNVARHFDGNADYMLLPAEFNPSSGNFSVAAWINGAAAPYRGGRAILSAYPNGTGWGFYLYSATPSALHLASPNAVAVAFSSGYVADGSWYHVGLTWNATTYEWQFFINGALTLLE